MALRPLMIETALRRLTGDQDRGWIHVCSVQKKGQSRIWRVAGTNPGKPGSFQRDGSDGALLYEGHDQFQRITSVEELRFHRKRLQEEYLSKRPPDCILIYEWEWAVLTDPEAQTKLERWIEEACRQPVEVVIGSESTFPTSLIIRLKSAEVFKVALARTLFEALPPRGTVWPMADRKRWLDAAAALFDMTYKH